MSYSEGRRLATLGALISVVQLTQVAMSTTNFALMGTFRPTGESFQSTCRIARNGVLHSLDGQQGRQRAAERGLDAVEQGVPASFGVPAFG
ncbi:hypothetical protein ACIBCN_43835 [Nocardia sp. NPDC051052]|uniref:hypothetical protein n=1 Tax=Nocardia sp. NPDC051052 TaxID=3364322 RepID=UPI00378F0F2C